MEDTRPDSEYLLKKLQYEEEQKLKKNKGKLKIFLGYAAGSGKTYTMLEAAHEAKNIIQTWWPGILNLMTGRIHADRRRG